MKRGLLTLALVVGVCRPAARVWAEPEYDSWSNRLNKMYGPSWIENKEKPEAPTETPSKPLTPLTIPFCFFFDAEADPARANAKIQFLVQAYAACGIALEARSFTLKPGYPTDYRKLSELLVAACPMIQAFGSRGAIQVESRFRELPAQMCGDPEASSCSTLCEPVAVSILGLGTDPHVALHESLHGNCCGPVCVNEGEGEGTSAGAGIELAWNAGAGKTRALASDLQTLSAPLTEAGCQALRTGASQSSVEQWFRTPGSENYVREIAPDRQVDLTLRKNILAPTYAKAPVTPAPAAPKKLLSEIAAKPAVPARPLPIETASPPARTPAREEVEETPAFRVPMDGERNRGSGLRKAKDPRRPSNQSGIGVIDAYGSGGGGAEGGASEESPH